MDKFLQYIGIAYLISVGLATPYFNWMFAQENGFVAWLFFGQIIPTFQAIVWPYFVFF
jgi:hypothetical protein|tara:strand:+ start:359 stop:532 length:174 start_codon:yes stop_codon:yes gene_type:complete